MANNNQEFSSSYYHRRIKANKIIRKINFKRRQISAFRVLCRILLIILICTFGIFVLKLPLWHINQTLLMRGDKSVIQIVGNTITPTYRILDMVRQTNIENIEIFRLNTKEIENNIKQLEPIKNVYVRRFWFPARFFVVVEEEYPVFSILPNLNSEPVSAITYDGVLIGHDYMPLNPNIKTIKIIGNTNYSDWSKEKVDKILNAKRILETYSGQKVQYIDMTKDDDIYFKMENVMLRAGDINFEFQKRAEALVSILPEIDEIKDKIEYIDLRWESKYIKLKPASPSLYPNEDNKPQ